MTDNQSCLDRLKAHAEGAIRCLNEMGAKATAQHRRELAVLDALIGAIDAIIKPKEDAK